MESEKRDPGESQQPHPTPEVAYWAVWLLNATTTFCSELGIEVSIGVYDLTRDAFDRIEDFDYGDFPGFVHAPDPKNPMWWKRAPGRINIYTREPPTKKENVRRGDRPSHAPGSAGEE